MTIPVRSNGIVFGAGLLAAALACAEARADATDLLGLLGDADAIAGELQSSDVSRRRDALDRLLAHNLPVPDALLVKLLDDSDAEVEARAVLLIGRRQLVQHLGQLRKRLTDPRPRLRIAAASALAMSPPQELGRHREIIGALERATSDADGDVRLAALEALLRLPRDQMLPVLDAIARAIEDERVAIRLVATEGAGQLRHRQLLVPLLGRLSDPAREVRTAALEALGKINDPRVAAALQRQASEGPDEVRGQALLALGQLVAPTVVPFLKQVLLEGPERLRGRAISALALAGRNQPPLAASIAHDLVTLWPRDELRPALVEALLTIGGPAAPAVAELLLRPSLAEAEGAVRLLAQLPHPGNVGPLLDELTRRRARPELVIDALGRHLALGDRRVAPALLTLCTSDDRLTRRAAMAALAGRLDERAQSVLLSLLTSTTAPGDLEQQRFAVRELGRLGLRDAREELHRLLGRGAPELVADVAAALARVGDESTPARLEALLGHASPTVRKAAAESLAMLASPAMIGPLCRRLRHASASASPTEAGLPDVLLALEGTLRGRSDEVARELLLAVAEQRGPIYAEPGIAALGAMRDPEAGRRLQSLAQRRTLPTSTRAAAVRALFGQPSTARYLTELLMSDDAATLRAEAAWALRGTSDPTAKEALKLMQERAPDPSVRANAQAALQYAQPGSSATRPHFVHVRIEDNDHSARSEVRYRIVYPGGLQRHGRSDATGTVHDEAIPDGPFELVVLD